MEVGIGGYEAAAFRLEKPRSLFRLQLRRFMRHHLAVLGGIIIVVQLGLATFSPLLAPYNPSTPDFGAVLASPSAKHLFGTDDLGRDILTRLIYGARISLAVGLTSVFMATIVGVLIGLIAGYFGGLIDGILMRWLDSLMAIPSLVLALTIAAVLGPGVRNATIAIAVTAVPLYARVIRGQVLSVKQNEYIEAERSLGASSPRILVRHILPNAWSPVLVQVTLGIGFAIITESSLSFIGLGAQPPVPTWGSMIQVGFQYLETAPWFALAPATMIFLAVLGYNLLGDGLRDALDPTTRH